MNPDMVTFTDDELWSITRVRMSKWLGIPLHEWDAMTYYDQCVAIEIRRADGEIAKMPKEMRHA